MRVLLGPGGGLWAPQNSNMVDHTLQPTPGVTTPYTQQLSPHCPLTCNHCPTHPGVAEASQGHIHAKHTTTSASSTSHWATGNGAARYGKLVDNSQLMQPMLRLLQGSRALGFHGTVVENNESSSNNSSSTGVVRCTTTGVASRR